MRSNWRIPLSCFLAVVILSTGLLWLRQKPAEAPAPEQSQLTPASVELRWRVGTVQHYSINVDSSMQMNAGDELSAPSLDVLIDADLEVHTLEADTESALVGFRFSSVNLLVAGESDPAANTALAEAFRVRFVSGGVPESFEYPAPVIAEHRLILANLVRMFQVNLQPGDEWAARESTELGHYTAAYQRITPTAISKRKHGFVGLDKQPMFVGAMITSNETIELDPQRDWITAMTTSETLATNGQQGTKLKIRNQATLTLLSSARVSASAATWVFDAATLPSKGEAPDVASSLSPEEAKEELLVQLATLNDTADGRIVLIHRLRDLLVANKAQPGILLDAMQSVDLTDRTRADIYLAFELAGTVEAQAALISVTSDATLWSSRDAVRAVVALSGVSNPVSETLATLWDLSLNSQSDDQYQLSSTATFALGSVGKTMRLARSSGYSELKTRLIDGAMAGATPNERANYIHALGNTQDDSLAPDVVVLLQDEDSSVRLATAQSLGAIGVDSVADQLMTRLVDESNGSVRGAIGEALTGWSTPGPDAMETAKAMLKTEHDENARLNMARFLGVNLDKFPENEPLLRQLLRVEPSKHIRQSILELLAENS